MHLLQLMHLLAATHAPTCCNSRTYLLQLMHLHAATPQTKEAAQEVVTAARVLRMLHLLKLVRNIYYKICEDVQRRRDMQALMHGTHSTESVQ
jgi:hypothetical protein